MLLNHSLMKPTPKCPKRFPDLHQSEEHRRQKWAGCVDPVHLVATQLNNIVI